MKRNPNLKCSCARSAFTLVELLVVIMVIAILAALLLPALTQAKHKAQMIKCVSNLHQIGIGLRMYVEDHNATFPPANSDQFPFDPKRPFLRYGDALGGVDGDLGPFYWGSAGISELPSAKDRLLA